MEQLSRRDARLFNKVISELGKYHSFSNQINDGNLHITGNLDIGFGEQNRYSIKIIVSNKFPDKIPEVHEIAGRVPSVMDRHFMSDNSGCCLVMPHLYRHFFKPLMTIEDFIDILVVPFFQNQLYYEINGSFVQGYQHGEKGMMEYYSEIFGKGLSFKTLQRLLMTVLMQREDGKTRICGHKRCPCESGRIQRQCHGKGLISLKEFGSSIHIKNTLTILQDLESLQYQSKNSRQRPPHGSIQSTCPTSPGRYRTNNYPHLHNGSLQ